MKVGVVGLGYWGPQLVRNLQFIDDCTQVVVCDLDETKIKAITRTYPAVIGVRGYEDLLADPDLGAVVLATPVTTHVPLAEQALEADKSVLVEKPLASSAVDADRLITLARARGHLVMAAHTFLYSPAVRCAKDLLLRGEFGEPLYIQSSRVNLGIHQSDVSVIWDLAPHDCSILSFWLGETASRVSARGRSTHRVGPPDVAFIDLEFPSGCIANLHLSWLAPTKVRRTTLVGSKKMLVYEDTNYEEPLKIYDKGLDLPDPQDFGEFKATYRSGDVLSPRVPVWEPLRLELQDFLRRVREGQTPDQREEDARGVVAMVEAAERSFGEGGRVVEL